MTLRQALRTLSDQGLVQQQPGRGTFVTPTSAAYRLETLRSLADELRSQGLTVTTTVRSAQMRALPKAVAAALTPAVKGLRLERVRAVDGRPVAHQISWVPEPYAAAVAGTDFTTTPLYAALAESGAVAIAAANEVIRPDLLPANLAAVLGRPAGSPGPRQRTGHVRGRPGRARVRPGHHRRPPDEHPDRPGRQLDVARLGSARRSVTYGGPISGSPRRDRRPTAGTTPVGGRGPARPYRSPGTRRARGTR